MNDFLISWISANLLPFEGELRGWLRRTSGGRDNEDDIIQEAYCRIGSVADLSQIKNGRAYFYTTVRRILIERFRKDRIVKLEPSAEIDSLNVIDESPSAERVLDGRQRYELVCRLIDGLPERCRDVFVMRKVHQLTQRQTAERLGLTENVVEKEVARGLKLLLRALNEMESDPCDERESG